MPYINAKMTEPTTKQPKILTRGKCEQLNEHFMGAQH